MKRLYLFLIGIVAVSVIALSFVPSDAYIPPTRAFARIFAGSGNITADSYFTNVTFVGHGITITPYFANKTVQFVSSASYPALEQLSNVTSAGCAVNQIRKVSVTGIWTCADLSGSGEVNDGANVGTGTGLIYRDKTGVTLNFKTLKEGSNISITNNADDVTISSSGGSGITKVNSIEGGTARLLNYNSTTTAILKSLTAARGITMTNGSGTITIDAPLKVANQTQSKDFFIQGINNATGLITRLQFSVNNVSTTCGGTDKVNSVILDNVTGYLTVTCSAVASSGFTKINSLDGGDAGIVATNTTLSNTQATFKTLTGTANNVTVTNGTKSLTFNLGPNVVTTGGSSQTITKTMTLNSVARLQSNAADVGDTGIIRLGNNEKMSWEAQPAGTDGCINFDTSEILYLQPGCLTTDSIWAAVGQAAMNFAGTVEYHWNGTHFDMGSSNKIAGSMGCSNGQSLTYTAATGQWDCTAAGSGFTNINNMAGGTAKVLATNSSNKANFKSLTAARGISITNGSTTITIDAPLKVANQTVSKDVFVTGINNVTGLITTNQFSVNNQTVTKDQQIVGINNFTGVITRNQFSVNTNTCTAGQFVSAVDNATGYVTCSSPSGGVTTLAANVTLSTSASVDTVIWTIPLTANSGNTIDGVITATSATSGNAVRAAMNVTNLNTRGYCMVTQVLTTTTNSIDNIVMNTVATGRATNTQETAWIAAAQEAEPILFTCSLKTGPTGGNLKIWGTQEIGGTASSVKAGSYYIKTP